MAERLPTPTVELVHKFIGEFDDADAGVSDRAITQLIAQLPQNTVLEHVLLKVVAINTLYATQIYAVIPMARHITGLSIDADLASGSPDAVDRIAHVRFNGKPRRLYSFATKYCSWHNPTAYPIYDSQVIECLWAYQHQDHFAPFARQDLADYAKFLSILKAFRDFYGLHSLTFKQLDQFLWLQGKQQLLNRDKSKQQPSFGL